MPDQNILNWVRPPWIQFLQMQSNDDFDLVARRLFGRSPAGYYNRHKFSSRLGIDITKYEGWYAEVGGDQGVIGPVQPRTIKPILAIRMTRRGNFQPIRMELEGLYNEKLRLAWIKVDDFEEALGDRFFFDIVGDDA